MRWLAAVLFCSSMITGCGGHLPPLTRRVLPDLSFELPVGPKLRQVSEIIDEQAGAVTVAGTDTFGAVLAMVRWWRTGAFSRAQLEELAAGVGSKALVPVSIPGLDAESFWLTTSSGPMLISQRVCGRLSVLVSSTTARDPERLHAHLVKSVTCQPSKTEHARANSIPWQLDMPDWFMTSRKGNFLRLSDGVSFLVLYPMPPSTQEQARIDAKPILDYLATVGARDAGVSRTADEVTNPIGNVRLLYCPNAVVIVLELSPDQAHADALDAKVVAGRCIPPGEPAQSWPLQPPR